MSCTWITDVQLTQNDVRTWGGEEDSEPDVELFFECGGRGADQEGMVIKKRQRGEK